LKAERNKEMPLVSIGLPVYNGENFLAEAIEAILNQTFTDFELIISDNASTDRTEEICRKYAAKDSRILYSRNDRNLGAIANYNLVFERSSGRYFKWAAHDDLIATAFLERGVEVLERKPEVVLWFPGIGYMDAQGRAERIAPGELSVQAGHPAERLHCFVNHQKNSTDIFWAVFGLIRSHALRQTGLLGKFVASDQVLLMRLLLLGQFYQLPDCLYFRRVHPLASTVKLPKSRTYRERVKWYDAQSSARVILPNWRLILEALSAVKGAQLKRSAQAGCYFALARMFAQRWKRLGRELLSVPTQFLISQ
jgi:glycosyltransferase involved in cell wall biosynthesis